MSIWKKIKDLRLERKASEERFDPQPRVDRIKITEEERQAFADAASERSAIDSLFDEYLRVKSNNRKDTNELWSMINKKYGLEGRWWVDTDTDEVFRIGLPEIPIKDEEDAP